MKTPLVAALLLPAALPAGCPRADGAGPMLRGRILPGGMPVAAAR